jgi:hypothetical protein
MRNFELEFHLILRYFVSSATMPPAFLIVRLETSNQLPPTIRRSEAVLSTVLPAISISDPNYTWASTRPIPTPNAHSTQVTFHVAIDKRDGDIIEVYGDYWDYYLAVSRSFELVAEEVLGAIMEGEEHELATIFKSRSNEANALLRLANSSRLITWQIVEVAV